MWKAEISESNMLFMHTHPAQQWWDQTDVFGLPCLYYQVMDKGPFPRCLKGKRKGKGKGKEKKSWQTYKTKELTLSQVRFKNTEIKSWNCIQFQSSGRSYHCGDTKSLLHVMCVIPYLPQTWENTRIHKVCSSHRKLRGGISLQKAKGCFKEKRNN